MGKIAKPKRFISRVKLLVEWEQAERKERATPSGGREHSGCMAVVGADCRLRKLAADPCGDGPQAEASCLAQP